MTLPNRSNVVRFAAQVHVQQVQHAQQQVVVPMEIEQKVPENQPDQHAQNVQNAQAAANNNQNQNQNDSLARPRTF